MFYCSGAYGIVPNPVLAATEATFRSIEGNIDRFIKLRLSEYLDPARHRMAKFLGAGPEEIVFVPSCSHGLNTVLKNLLWNEGDIIIGGRYRIPICQFTPRLLTWSTATTTYSSVERTLQYIADLPPHPSVSVFELKFPITRASALQAFRVHLDALNAELQTAQRKIGNRTKLKIVAVINSISSVPGVYLPWKEMVALCRERGVLTVVDAAHSIGQEPNINLSKADPDFWASVGSYSFECSTNAQH
jgi:selenocysteine lyase/cysteine desulfurase